MLTFVGGYEEKQVSAAIHRELMREGQVFFVHNNVSSIERTAARIRELVPDARVETTARVTVPLPLIPAFARDVVPLDIPLSASHLSTVDRFRAAP